MPSNDFSLSEKVAQLKESIQDVLGEEEKLQSDLYLYHWLRANQYHLTKTEKAVRANLKWRQDNGIPELAKKDLDAALEARIVYLHTKGIEGIPVAFFSAATDMASILDEEGEKRTLLHVAQKLAKQENLVHEFDEAWSGTVEELPAERSIGCCTIFDMAGYSISQNFSMKVLQLVAEYFNMLINYFPTAGHVVVLVNATTLLEVPLEIVKAIVADRLELDIHGNGEEDVAVVSYALKPEQLRELQSKAKEILGVQ